MINVYKQTYKRPWPRIIYKQTFKRRRSRIIEFVLWIENITLTLYFSLYCVVQYHWLTKQFIKLDNIRMLNTNCFTNVLLYDNIMSSFNLKIGITRKVLLELNYCIKTDPSRWNKKNKNKNSTLWEQFKNPLGKSLKQRQNRYPTVHILGITQVLR